MLTANNLIFDSTDAAANGGWRNVNNWTAFSIHVKGLEGNVWVEVCNDPACLTTPSMSGVPITGNLADKTASTGYQSNPNPADTTDQADTVFTTDGTQAMWSPACLVWNFVRVCKTGGSGARTQAFLFGQQG